MEPLRDDPDPGDLADPYDDRDWDVDRNGRMRDHADEQPPATIVWEGWLVGYALNLPNALRARGLRVEVVPGWETRSAGSFNPKGAVAHWTAGPRGSTGRPSLNVCTYGRPGLDGPLCNVYGARDGTAIVVAAGRANHAGTGGWRGLVGNSAVFGTEMEGADASDFTPAQRWAYPRIHAAYCDLGGFGPDMNCGHSEWAGPRKQDINGYTPDRLRADIASVLAGHPTLEDDMAYNDWDDASKLQLMRDIWGFGVVSRDGTAPAQNVLREIQQKVVNIPGDVINTGISDPDKDAREGTKNATSPLWAFVQAGARAATNANATVASQGAALAALTQLVAQQNGLTLADVERVVTDAVARGVQVDVNVGTKTAWLMQGPDQNHVMGKWYLWNRLSRVWRRNCLNYSCGYYETYQS